MKKGSDNYFNGFASRTLLVKSIIFYQLLIIDSSYIITVLTLLGMV